MAKLFSVLLIALAALTLSACDQSPAERAGENIEDAAENASDAVEDTAEDVSDAVEDAADKVD